MINLLIIVTTENLFFAVSTKSVNFFSFANGRDDFERYRGEALLLPESSPRTHRRFDKISKYSRLLNGI